MKKKIFAAVLLVAILMLPVAVNAAHPILNHADLPDIPFDVAYVVELDALDDWFALFSAEPVAFEEGTTTIFGTAIPAAVFYVSSGTRIATMLLDETEIDLRTFARFPGVESYSGDRGVITFTIEHVGTDFTFLPTGWSDSHFRVDGLIFVVRVSDAVAAPAPTPAPSPTPTPAPAPTPTPAPAPTPAAAGISVTVNGQAVTFRDQNPANVDGRVLVPVRGVFEMLGFDVNWNRDTEQVTLTGENYTVVMTIGSDVFTTNGTSHRLDVPAQIIGGRAMVPIRRPLESVGFNVRWDGATETVVITGDTAATGAAGRYFPDIEGIAMHQLAADIMRELYDDGHNVRIVETDASWVGLPFMEETSAIFGRVGDITERSQIGTVPVRVQIWGHYVELRLGTWEEETVLEWALETPRPHDADLGRLYHALIAAGMLPAQRTYQFFTFDNHDTGAGVSGPFLELGVDGMPSFAEVMAFLNNLSDEEILQMWGWN